PYGILIVRITSVYENVSRAEKGTEFLDCQVYRFTGRYHQPDDSLFFQRVYQIFDRRSGGDSFVFDGIQRLLIEVKCDNFMSMLMHVEAEVKSHFSESDESDLHEFFVYF